MKNKSNCIQAVKKVLGEESSSPSAEFMRFLEGRVGSLIETRTGPDRSLYASIVKEAFRQFVADRINDRSLADPCREKVESLVRRSDCHTSSDEEFEGFFVVNVA